MEPALTLTPYFDGPPFRPGVLHKTIHCPCVDSQQPRAVTCVKWPGSFMSAARLLRPVPCCQGSMFSPFNVLFQLPQPVCNSRNMRTVHQPTTQLTIQCGKSSHPNTTVSILWPLMLIFAWYFHFHCHVNTANTGSVRHNSLDSLLSLHYSSTRPKLSPPAFRCSKGAVWTERIFQVPADTVLECSAVTQARKAAFPYGPPSTSARANEQI